METILPSLVQRGCVAILPFVLILAGPAHSQNDSSNTIDFRSDRWDCTSAVVSDYLGRTAVAGSAVLMDPGFRDGVIEVDMAVTGAPDYPGILFRTQSIDDCERVYFRPHRAGRYPDALQYTPSFRGVSGWQLYSGPGYTAPVALPPGQWIHVRLEFSGAQARVFVGDAQAPSLVVDHLAREPAAGGIALLAATGGSSFFSNFRCHPDDSLVFDPPRPVDIPPGMIRRWEISQVFKLARLDPERPYSEQSIGSVSWTPIEAEQAGRIDFCRWVARPQGEQSMPDAVFARTTIHARKDEVRPIIFGYSDAVSFFLNGRLLYSGQSAYRQRDPSFLGIMGLFDELYLPLKKGDNELVACVAEAFGGWGFICQDGSAILQAEGVRTVNETPREFNTPESAAWDPVRKVFYVSNYDPGNESKADGGQFLSRLGPDGRVRDARWIGGLANPTGLAVRGDTLCVVERMGLAMIDLSEDRIARRVPIPAGQFLNDIALDSAGAAYVTDSGAATIHRVSGRTCEAWLTSRLLAQVNGICVSGDSLLVGCSADARIRSVQLATKALRNVATLSPGSIDGLCADGRDDILFSHVEGRVYRISAKGSIEKILDLTTQGTGCADFGFAPESGTLVIPTFQDGRVLTYQL